MSRTTFRVLTAGFVVAASLCLGLLAPLAAQAAPSPGGYSARLATLINQAREQQGVSPLQVEAGTSEVAAVWAQHLARTGTLAHNENLGSQLSSHGSSGWTAAAENVGSGSTDDADGLFQAYMRSPEHRANIVSASFRYLGISTVFSGSSAWNVMDFVDVYHGVSAPVAAPRAQPRRVGPARAAASSQVAKAATHSAPMKSHAVRAEPPRARDRDVTARTSLVRYQPAVAGLNVASGSDRMAVSRASLEAVALGLVVAVVLGLVTVGDVARRRPRKVVAQNAR